MVVRVGPSDQSGVDVAAKAQLDSDILLLYGMFELVVYVNNMTKPVRLPG